MTDYRKYFGQNALFLIIKLGSKVQRLISSFNYSYGINGIGKKREAINPERRTLNLKTQTDRMSNLCAIRQYIKVYGHFYLVNDEVCIYLGLSGSSFFNHYLCGFFPIPTVPTQPERNLIKIFLQNTFFIDVELDGIKCFVDFSRILS